MPDLLERFEAFTGGLITTVTRIQIPPNAYRIGRNTAFRLGTPLELVTRPGLRYNYFPHGDPDGRAYVALYHWNAPDGNQYLIGVHNTGGLDVVDSTASQFINPPTQILGPGDLWGGTTWPFCAAPPVSPRIIVANDLVIGTSGTGVCVVWQPSWDEPTPDHTGTTRVGGYQGPLGIPVPTVAPTLTPLTGGLSIGPHEICYTWYHVPSDSESSPSPVATDTTSNTVPVRGYKITLPSYVVMPGYPDGTWRVRFYLRKPAFQTTFYHHWTWDAGTAGSGTPWDPVNGFVIGLPQATNDLVNDALNALTVEMPLVASNDPPPRDLLDLCWHQSRLWVTDGDLLYYSKLGHPHQFDLASSFERVGLGDGQTITGIRSYDEDTLLIFKTRSIYTLSGDSPQSWQLRKLPGEVGAMRAESITELEGRTFFWSAFLGPHMLGDGLTITSLAQAWWTPEMQGPDRGDANNRVIACADPHGRRILWARSISAPWSVCVYSVGLNCWESDGWDLGLVGAMVSVRTTNAPAQSRQRYFVAVSGYEIDTATPYLAVLDEQWRQDGLSTSGAQLTATILGTSSDLTRLYIPYSATSTYYLTTGTARVIDIGATTPSIHTTHFTHNSGVVSLSTPLPNTIGATSSYVVFNTPLALLQTKLSDQGLRAAKKRFLFAFAEGTTSYNYPGELLLGFTADERSPAVRTWRQVVTLSTPLKERIATTGLCGGFQAAWYGDLQLTALALRSEPRHDRR